MTRKERDNRRTDQAWNKVYHRLEKDGLLTCKEKEGVMPYGDIPRLTTRKIVLLGLQVAAIISFFLIIHFNRTEEEADRTLLTRQNTETRHLKMARSCIWQEMPLSVIRNISNRTKEKSPYREMLFSTLPAIVSVLS